MTRTMGLTALAVTLLATGGCRFKTETGKVAVGGELSSVRPSLMFVTADRQIVVADNDGGKELWLKVFSTDGALVAERSFDGLMGSTLASADCGSLADLGTVRSTYNDFSVLCGNGEDWQVRVSGGNLVLGGQEFNFDADGRSVHESAMFAAPNGATMAAVSYREDGATCGGDGHPYLGWSRGRAGIALNEVPVDLKPLVGCPEGALFLGEDEEADEVALLAGDEILVFSWDGDDASPNLVDRFDAPSPPWGAYYTDMSYKNGQIVLAQQRSFGPSYLFLIERSTGTLTSNWAVDNAVAADWLFSGGAPYAAWYTGLDLDGDFVLSEVTVVD
jgi:hypothetical protein